MQAAVALDMNDLPAPLTILGTPAFKLGPKRTLALLANMPYLHNANIETQYASVETEPGGAR